MKKGMFQFKTIGSRLLTGVLAVTVVVVLLIMILVGNMSSRVVIQKSEEMADAKNQALANQIIAEYNSFYQLAVGMEIRIRARLMREIKDRTKLSEIILDGLETSERIVGAGVFFEPNGFDGKDRAFAGKPGYDKTGRISEYYTRNSGGQIVKDLEDTSDLDNQSWYRGAMDDGSVHFSEPYIQDGITMSTVSVPIFDKNNKAVGVVTADINLEPFQKTLEEASDENTLFQIITEKGVIAGDGLDRSHVLKPYEQIGGKKESIEKIAKGEPYSIEQYSPSLKQQAYIKYTPIDFPHVSESWSVGSVWSMKHFTEDVNTLILTMAVIAIVGLLLICAVVIILSRKLISKPMADTESLVKQLSEFDFVIESHPKTTLLLGRNDEIGNISRSIEVMVSNIRGLIQRIIESAQNVAATSQELTATAETNRESVQEIANAIEDIAHSATEQAQNTEKTSENVENIGEMIEKNMDVIRSLTEATEEIEQRKNEGNDIIRELITSSEKSSEAAVQIFDTVKETNDSAERIETVSEMIQSIADQTNLLALNAAIEAARAGESGKGFAVVAEEIRKLAEQSTGFTGEIKQVITDLKARTVKAVDAMSEVKLIAQQQKDSSGLTGEKFEMISHSVEIIREMVETLNNTAQTMQSSKIRIVEGVQDLSGIAQQNAASSEEVASTAQNQLEAIVGIADASSELSQIAADLQNEVQAFRV